MERQVPVMSSPSRRTRASAERRDSYLRRFQLLRYRDVSRLCEVMETVTPIHGCGNFPTLEIRPSQLIQLVRDRLEKIGVKVRDIRLNGSAATHVLSDDVIPTYKDLDLIFAVDFPSSDNEVFNEKNVSNGQSFAPSSLNELPRKRSSSVIATGVEPTASCEANDCWSVDDSGYTSSGSSVVSDAAASSASSLPPLLLKGKKRTRPRARSMESNSSSSSPLPSRLPSEDISASSNHFSLPQHHNWQEIKDVTMDILMEFLPANASRCRMDSVVLGSAYVQKMVKVCNDTDRWSLISLNNNSGRNIELKFVHSMKRQFEFSVDSFQIILDTYLAFRHAADEITCGPEMSDAFHPTVVAESVYGNFEASLRHLRERRICTHRPEEIRGGGLLRYCNLLARDFIPGDCGDSPMQISQMEKHMCARFFIDFNDIEQQRRKVISYLDGHFQNEEELMFQYLLILRRVVDNSTFCLMQHERTMVLDLITMLVRQSLAENVAKNVADSRFGPNAMETKTGDSVQQRPPCSDYFNYRYPSQQHYVSYQPCDSSSPYIYRPFGASGACPAPHCKPVSAGSSMSSRSNRNSMVRHSCNPSFGNYRNEPQMACCSCCCCCCSCCAFSRSDHPYYASNSACRDQCYPAVMQPIYYNASNVACYYQPAGHGHV